MNIYAIVFKPRAGIEINEDTLDSLTWYLAYLSKNGQIQNDYALIKIDNCLRALVTAYDDDALDKKNNSIYADKQLQKTEELFDISTEMLGKDMDFDDPCSCENPSWYLLYSDWMYRESPIMCGHCAKTIPLYKFPCPDGSKDHEGVLFWLSAYKNMHYVYMDSMYDRFTLRQMRNPKSKLSKMGIDLCREYEKATNKPFYYFLYQTRYCESKPLNYKPSKRCPSCGSKWKVVIEGSRIDCKCDRCRLISYNRQNA